MSIPTEIRAWQMEKPEAPLVQNSLPLPELGPGDVLVEVAGCGLCHTDLSFLYGLNQNLDASQNEGITMIDRKLALHRSTQYAGPVA